jgi:hypothetical protein
VFKVNQLPNNGFCNVSPSSGQSFTTLFQITCHGWLDPDGYIERYEYLGLMNLFFNLFNLDDDLWFYTIAPGSPGSSKGELRDICIPLIIYLIFKFNFILYFNLKQHQKIYRTR